MELHAGQRDVGHRGSRSGYEAGSREQGYQARDLVSDYMAGSFDPGYQASARESQYTGQIDQGPIPSRHDCRSSDTREVHESVHPVGYGHS